MRFSRLGFLAMFAAFMAMMPGVQAAESVGDQADELEITAMDLERAGNLDGAIAKHRAAIALIEPVARYAAKVRTFKENFANTLLNAATGRYNAHDEAGSTALLEEALALDPAGRSAVTRRVRESLAVVKSGKLNQEGVALMHTGNYQAAAAKFREVLTLDATNRAARINLDVAESELAMAAGDPATAVTKLQDALTLDPDRQLLKDQLVKAQTAAATKAAEEASRAQQQQH
jgi:tetratricopeptide (TPR) repeat protein